MGQQSSGGQNSGGQSAQPATPPPPPIEKSFDIFSPGGDPGVLRACANAWRTMATELKSTRDGLDQQVNGLGGAWTGQAADSFHAHWDHTRQQIDTALPNFENVAKQLDAAADAIESINNQIDEIVVQIAATAAIGIGLSIVTAGFSDVAAATDAAAEAAEAGAAVAQLARVLNAIDKVLEGIKDAMEDSKLLKIGITFAGNLAGDYSGNVLGQALSGQQVTWGADFQSAAIDAGFSTLLSTGAEAIAPKGKLGDVLQGNGLLGNVAMNGATSGLGQFTTDLVDGNAGSAWEDGLTSLAGGMLAGTGVHNGQKIYSGGDKHTPRDSAVSGTAYGLANAAENALNGEPMDHTPFDDGSPLVDPKGAMHP
ncbi:WXG100 family type VII secretion target [Kitasatospora sp. GAS204A]|uniref:WXG100 family type VII secretion target n=1 Tax=unclassified Kitasatospora TaxID=2633591 RepID=UPI002476CBE0|nr:WXG100 family type VII secretion target [Kitasatospora sp. GAS204B]MDH6118693.1 WXG100 family type VII secretion target [Kitasatospora sp. GAS204B]